MLKDRRRIADIIFLPNLMKGLINAPKLVVKFLVPREVAAYITVIKNM